MADIAQSLDQLTAVKSSSEAHTLALRLQAMSSELDYWQGVVDCLALIDDTHAEYPQEKLVAASRIVKPLVGVVPGRSNPLGTSESKHAITTLTTALEHATFELQQLKSVLVRFVAGPLLRQCDYLKRKVSSKNINPSPDWTAYFETVRSVAEYARTQRFSDAATDKLFEEGTLARALDPEKLKDLFNASLEVGAIGGVITPGLFVLAAAVVVMLMFAGHNYGGAIASALPFVSR